MNYYEIKSHDIAVESGSLTRLSIIRKTTEAARIALG